MNDYDYIFIGGSIPILLSANQLINKKILILEKDNYLGGAWRIDSDNLKNIDMCGHLIVPKNNQSGEEIIKYLKKLNIVLEPINNSTFYYETENWRSNGKQGTPLICRDGWTDFNKKIINNIKLNKNIKILLNHEVKQIEFSNDYFSIKTNNAIFKAINVVLPMYCNLDNIYMFINNNKIVYNIPYKKIINTHVILFIKIENESKLHNNFQGFYDKEPIKVFDRVSLSKKDDNNIILSCRISKSYKNIDRNIVNNLFKDFLVEKKIIDKESNIYQYYFYDYPCCYRSDEDRVKIYSNIKSIQQKILENKLNNKIFVLDSVYMGHFLQNLINDKILI